MGIVKASEEDAAEISGLIASEFPYTQATQENLRNRMGKLQFRLFKALEKGIIAGFLELEILNDFFGVWRINGIAVKKEFRQKGIGKELTAFGIGFAKGQGASRIVLLVRPDNYVAKKMYKKFGFESNGLWKSQVNGKRAEEWVLELRNDYIA